MNRSMPGLPVHHQLPELLYLENLVYNSFFFLQSVSPELPTLMINETETLFNRDVKAEITVRFIPLIILLIFIYHPAART